MQLSGSVRTHELLTGQTVPIWEKGGGGGGRDRTKGRFVNPLFLHLFFAVFSSSHPSIRRPSLEREKMSQRWPRHETWKRIGKYFSSVMIAPYCYKWIKSDQTWTETTPFQFRVSWPGQLHNILSLSREGRQIDGWLNENMEEKRNNSASLGKFIVGLCLFLFCSTKREGGWSRPDRAAIRFA